jgi:hypothetical protein
MQYHEEKSVWDEVNRRGSRLWSQMNDNSKSALHRQKFVADHGGFFTRNGRYWSWTNPVKEHNGYRLKRVDTGEVVFFESMKEFGDLHGLTAVKICELLNGKRKTYKGWTAFELREVKDGVAGYVKMKEPKKKKTIIGKTITLQDKVTGEVFTVTNLKEFSRNNDLDYAAVKKLAKGKVKSHKNLKLYDPLAQYKDSPEPK